MRQIQRKKRYKRVNIEGIDIREVLDEIGIEYQTGGSDVSSGWIGVNCPFCSDPLFHLGINLDRKTISCWRCGTKGTVIKFLMEVLGSLPKALEVLQKYQGRELWNPEEQEKIQVTKVELPLNTTREMPPYHRHYLEKIRRFNADELKDKYNLHFTGPNSNWPNKIIVPVIKNYRLVTFTSVDISYNAKIKYRHESKEKSIIPIKDHLYGIEDTNKYSVIVVEGLFDKYRVGDNCIALFGVVPSKKQMQLLSQFNRIILAFDADNAGSTEVEKVASDLSIFADVIIAELPEGKDPDELNREELKRLGGLL